MASPRSQLLAPGSVRPYVNCCSVTPDMTSVPASNEKLAWWTAVVEVRGRGRKGWPPSAANTQKIPRLLSQGRKTGRKHTWGGMGAVNDMTKGGRCDNTRRGTNLLKWLPIIEVFQVEIPINPHSTGEWPPDNYNDNEVYFKERAILTC